MNLKHFKNNPLIFAEFCRRVQHLMGAIAMRRTKKQMVDGKPIVELPERNVFVEHVKLSEEERSLYDAMQNEGKIIVSRQVRSERVPHGEQSRVLAINLIVLKMAHYILIKQSIFGRNF